MHTLKFKFEVYNSADIRLILKAAICPSLCHTEDVLTARVAVLLPVFAANFATSSCCTPYQMVLMSTAFWWAHPSENYCVHMLCTVQRVWPTYSPFQRLHLTLMISKNRLLYSVWAESLYSLFFRYFGFFQPHSSMDLNNILKNLFENNTLNITGIWLKHFKSCVAREVYI